MRAHRPRGLFGHAELARPSTALVFVRALGLLASFAACGACRASSGPAIVHPNHPDIRYGGWFDQRAPRAVRFAWPGTHIMANFQGTSLWARFTHTPLESGARSTNWLAVVIDDAPPRALALAEGVHVYPLARGLSPGLHRVTIWKRTEPDAGVVTFHGLVLDPGRTLGPLPPAKERRLVFIGDSVTAGYGNEGADGTLCSAGDTNNYTTYGANAARELNAEYAAAAWSGKGLTRNYAARDVATMPELQARVIPTENTSREVPREPADVVVVNLGTNDLFRGVPESAEFIEAYRALVESLRTRYPRALLVLQIGPMLSDEYPQPQARTLMRAWLGRICEQRRALGDERCALLEFRTDPREGVGCDAHPNVTTHARLGRELAALIRARLRW